MDTRTLIVYTAAIAAAPFTQAALGVPYAAQVRRSGDTVNWVLNEQADHVTITRDGGHLIALTNVPAGAQSFDMTGFNSYSIEVVHSEPLGWTESSVSLGNPLMNFERANGLAVNNNPGSPNFGRFYVSHPRTSTTLAGRDMGDGIYVYNADGTDLGGITDPNDTSAARQAGLGVYFDYNPGGLSSSSPFRIEVGRDDRLYISDWSDTNGGMYVTNADVTAGQLLLANPGGDPYAVNVNPGQNHGSIVSTPVVKGSMQSGSLQLWTIDEDLEAGEPGHAQHIWRYDIGADPGPNGFNGAPTLVVDTDLTGPYGNGLNSDGSRIFFPDVPGVDVDISYDHVHDNFIVTQRRNDGNESGLVIYNGDFSQMLFNSRQFSIDHNLDGAEDDLLVYSWDGIQDIFRGSADAVVSLDGSFMVINRSVVGDDPIYGVNDFFGPGGALIVPLDANGLPDLDLTDVALANPINDVPDNIMLGTTGITATAGNGFRSPIAIDLVGNVYYATNNGQVVQVFSPGGPSSAVTRSDGTFTINGVLYIPEPAAVAMLGLGAMVFMYQRR